MGDSQSSHKKTETATTVFEIDKQRPLEDHHKTSLKDSDLDLKTQIKQWKSRVETLMSNSALMTYALAKKRNQFSNVVELVQYLKSSPAQTDLEKAWVIYVWVCDNIRYDTDGFRSGNHGDTSANGTLSSGKSVCDGYAGLFKQLINELGLECEQVSGISKAFGYEVGSKLSAKSDHAWNVIKIDNKWEYVESTWGAGHVDKNFIFVKQFQPFYFLVPPDIFIEKHFSESFQLQKQKLTLEEFETHQVTELEFYLLGLECKSHKSCRINPSTKTFFMEFESDKELKLTTDISDKEDGQKCESFMQYGRDEFKFKYCLFVTVPHRGRKYLLNLFGILEKTNGEFGNSSSCPLIAKYAIQCQNSGPEFDFSQIPKYDLCIEHGIKCLSHSTSFITFKSNPLNMRFNTPENISIMFDLVTNDKVNKIEGSVLQQIDPSNPNDVHLSVAVPTKNETYRLNIFAKNSNDNSNSFTSISEFWLIRTGSNSSDGIKFVRTFADSHRCFIHKPVELALKRNQIYEFKYTVNGAVDVALFDSEENWFHFHKGKDNDVWILDESFDRIGKLTLFVKFKEAASFSGICEYDIVG